MSSLWLLFRIFIGHIWWEIHVHIYILDSCSISRIDKRNVNVSKGYLYLHNFFGLGWNFRNKRSQRLMRRCTNTEVKVSCFWIYFPSDQILVAFELYVPSYRLVCTKVYTISHKLRVMFFGSCSCDNFVHFEVIVQYRIGFRVYYRSSILYLDLFLKVVKIWDFCAFNI